MMVSLARVKAKGTLMLTTGWLPVTASPGSQKATRCFGISPISPGDTSRYQLLVRKVDNPGEPDCTAPVTSPQCGRTNNMRGHSGVPLLPVASVRLVGFAVGLALATGCGGKPEAKAPAADQAGAAAGAQDAGGKPLIALIRAADWMGSEWGEDAIKVGLQESDLEAGRDYEMKVSSAQGDLATLPSLIDAAIDAKAKV